MSLGCCSSPMLCSFIFCMGAHFPTDPIHMERTKYKIMGCSFQNVIKWSKLCGSLRKKIDHVKIMIYTLNFWRNDVIWIILQDVLDLQSHKKIVVNFMWLTTLVPSSGWNIWSFELKLNKKILIEAEKCGFYQKKCG